jgi:hypothetical protein
MSLRMSVAMNSFLHSEEVDIDIGGVYWIAIMTVDGVS